AGAHPGAPGPPVSSRGGADAGGHPRTSAAPAAGPGRGLAPVAAAGGPARGSGAALVVGALLLTDRLLWAPGLTEDNVRRLRPGIPRAEVAAPPEAPRG